MVAHRSAAVVLLRFILPASLLFATCIVFTLPSLLFFFAFLGQHFEPSYEVTPNNFPTAYLLVLAVYSLLLIIAHIVLAALVASKGINLTISQAIADTLAIPNYNDTPLLSVKLLLAPMAVLIVTVALLSSAKPDGNGRYFTLRKRKKKNHHTEQSSGSSDVTNSAPELHRGLSSSFELEHSPATLNRLVVSKFSRHMAGRVGIFWTTIACGFTGLSYSSILTAIFLAVFSFVVVAWAFHLTSLHPQRLKYPFTVVVRSFRIFIIVYLVFIVSLQNPWFMNLWNQEHEHGTLRSALRLIGFVVLNTEQTQGWAFLTGFFSAIATYVFSGIFVKALDKVLQEQNDQNETDKVHQTNEDSEHNGYALSYYDTQFLYSILHLSSLGLLTWSLVFPGILTLPMMLSALAYFASKSVRHAKVFDRIIVYAILLQIAHFLFVAITTSFDSIESKTRKGVVRLLGLRKFEPQFTMNLVQSLALGLFCTNIFCKRYITLALQRNNGPPGFREFVRNAAFSATAKKQRAMHSTIRVILDQLALTSLYISAGTKASVLNSFFLVSLVVLCLCQAFGIVRRQKVMSFLWTLVLAYSTVFLLITCTACRAIEGFRKPYKCDLSLYGVIPATKLDVVAYTATIVFSAIQVHFTWSKDQNSSDNPEAVREEYGSRFWQMVRNYFLFLTYVALLLYPLIYPANFLSYGYVLFLAISILVELLGPFLRREQRSVRPLIKSYWPAVVLFSVCALLSRYIVRFDGLITNMGLLDSSRKWVFGFKQNNAVNEFHFTVGDASILIIVSLQGRFFGLDDLIKNSQHRAAYRHGERPNEVDPPIASNRLALNVGTPDRSALGLGTMRTIDDVDIQTTQPNFPPFRSLLEGSAEQKRGMPDTLVIDPLPARGNQPWITSSSLRGSAVDRSDGFEDSAERRLRPVADPERLNQLTQKIRDWRLSLPVKQTEKFLTSMYSHMLVMVRKSLLRYSFVLEACAILAAAVWLPGFSVFGAIYIILGCVLLLSEQSFYDAGGAKSRRRISLESRTTNSKARLMKILPIMLAILSFTLMSLQYVYFIIARMRQPIPQEYLFKYFGLRQPIDDKWKRTPIHEPAMLAHVLVFVTAFLQRVAVKWAAKDAKRINEEERQAECLDSYYPHQALGGAVNIGEVISGVGGRASSSALQVRRDSNEPVDLEEEALNQFRNQDTSISALDPPILGSSVRFGGESQISSVDPGDIDAIRAKSSTSSDDDDYDVYTGQGRYSSTRGPISRLYQKGKCLLTETRKLLNELILLLGPFWLNWGFDLTFMYLVVGGAVTRTSFSVIYVALVMAVSGHRLRKIAPHWHQITLLLTCLVLLQYFMTLGLPGGSETKPNQLHVWLYFDSKKASDDRKYDVTFAFLAVICASMTLNAVAPGPRGFRFWFKKRLTHLEPDQDASKPHLDSDETRVGTTERLPQDRIGISPSSVVSQVNDGNGAVRSRHPTDTSDGSVSRLPWGRNSVDEDFTQRPMALKNLIKLGWMRFSGSLVQLYMFAAAVAVTSIFNGILLLMSFYFLFNFTNVDAKKSTFFIVRFYVLSIVFVLVVYQAPFDKLGPWAGVLGLYKTSPDALSTDKNKGNLLLFLMVTLWLICQMQGRIYESASFKYVVKFGEEDAKVRFKRAVHEHNTRKYERMLGRNKNRRAKMARQGRLERLKKLRTAENRSVDRLYQVCVVDEMKVLRAKAESQKDKKKHIFSSHVMKEVEEEDEKSLSEGKRSKFLRFLFRGNAWRKYRGNPLSSEFRVFVYRYSAWAVYSTMLLASIVNPNELTVMYPLLLFLYLILEQPRPPKRVWQFLMCYVCLNIMAKFVLRETQENCANIFATNRPGLGLCKVAGGIFFDILTFLSLLWHRTVLYYRGLWDLQSTEEDMLLTNQIHGEKVETDLNMKLTKIPDIDSPSMAFTPSRYEHLEFSAPVSADQQCSDVAEVFKRKRDSITSWVNETEDSDRQALGAKSAKVLGDPNRQIQLRGPRAGGSQFKRSKTYTYQSPLPQSAPPMSSTPRPIMNVARSDTGSGDFSRYISLRRSSRKTDDEDELNMTESQSIVQKSLMQSKVIPNMPPSDRATGNLALFGTNSKSGIFAGFIEHFANLTKEHEHKAVGDYYILIFLVDFLSFVFVTFAFSELFSGDSNVQELPWWRVNFIRIKHLLTLMAMFCALVMDRIVYLTRSMRGKLILQYISVIIYHVIIFYLQENIRQSWLTKLFYILRCVYFLLSGLQIRNGFPTYTTAQFLLRNYTTPGIILFETYNFIPFLWLMRTLLDWAVVPTSLEIFQYFRFVDIYMWLYRNRAVNTSRGCFRRKLGQRRRWLPRVYQGFGIFLLCSIALFLPFLFFSILNPFVSAREPNRATLSVDLLAPVRKTFSTSNPKASYNIFTRSTFISNNDKIERKESKIIARNLGLNVSSLLAREREQSYLVDFGTISDEEWRLPPTAQQQLIYALGNSSSTNAKTRPGFVFELTAKTESQEFKIQEQTLLSKKDAAELRQKLDARESFSLRLKTNLQVYGFLDSGATKFRQDQKLDERWVCLRHIYPLSGATPSTDGSFWALQPCDGQSCTCTPTLDGLIGKRNQFVLKFAIVSVLQVGGSTILTLYAAILFTLANFMRGFFADKRLIIPYIDMPYTLHLYQLVLDIIYARQDNDLEMEEILYNGLTDIYRDQHVLAKWSGERALKLPKEWWQGSEFEEAYYCYPSFANTETEPYRTRIVE